MPKRKNKRTLTPEVRYIYLGPTVLAAGLVQNRVYIGAVDEAFKTAEKRFSLVRQLVVPLSELNTAKIAMRTKGTPQYLALQQIGGKK